MSDEETNKYFDELESNLRHELAREFTAASGLPFHEDKKDGQIKPKDNKEARLLEFGSASLNRGPRAFFDQAVNRFAKRVGIKLA